MTVYNLPDGNTFNVLLLGDPDFVLEFAGILDRHDVPFSILPSVDDVPDMDADIEGFEELGKGLIDSLKLPDAIRERMIYDLRGSAGSFTHVVDLCTSVGPEQRLTLELAASVNPRATVIASVLTNTATEIGLFANTASRTCGVTLLPSMMSTTERIDICAALNTSENHLFAAIALMKQLGFTPEVVEDRVALVQARVLVMLINEAAYAVMEGLATPVDIDKAMTLGVNYPKGLLAWADEIGIPTVTLILDALHREYRQERYRPCVLLKQYMRAEWNGRSSGRGFYTYE